MSFPQMKHREKSGREMRRLAEKQERKAYFNVTEYKRAELEAKQVVMERLQRNGITVDDLKANYDKGWDAGFRVAAEPTIKACYAAICLAASELYGFGQKRCCDLLNAVDQKIIYSLSSQDVIDEVLHKLGLEIDFKEAIDDRITLKKAKNE